jgi:predicted sugar kinase
MIELSTLCRITFQPGKMMRILKKKELIACKSSEGPFVNTIQSSAEHKWVRDTLLHLK